MLQDPALAAWRQLLDPTDESVLEQTRLCELLKRRHEVGAWDYPPLDEDTKAKAALLTEVLEQMSKS